MKTLDYIENFNDINIYRCKKCPLIPYINIKYEKLKILIETKCENNHYFIEEIENFFIYINNKKNNIVCSNDNNHLINFSKLYYCLLCKKYFCNTCLNHKHNLFNLLNFDTLCIEHNQKIIDFSLFDLKSKCSQCKYRKDKIISLNEEINNLNINEYKNKIEKFEHFYKQLLYIIEKFSNKFLYSNNIIQDFMKNIKMQYDILYNLYKSYIYKLNNNQMNFPVLENLVNNFNLKFPPIPENLNEFRNFFLNNNNFYIIENNPLNKIYKNTIFIYDLNLITTILTSEEIWCSIKLKDGRIMTGNRDHSIKVYNSVFFNKEFEINIFKSIIYYITQLSNDIIIVCSFDSSLTLIKLKNDKEYDIIDTLEHTHDEGVFKVIEMNSKNDLISCSYDKKIKIWQKNVFNKYLNIYTFTNNFPVMSVFKINNNEFISICRPPEINQNDFSLNFYNYKEKKKINSINNLILSASKYAQNIKNNLLYIGGLEAVYIINVEKYELIKTIDIIEDNCWITNLLILENNNILTSDYNGNIKLIEKDYQDDNSYIIKNIKKNAHDDWIFPLILLKKNIILTASFDHKIKIWEIKI